jgi:acetoin utilization protein AcuB
MVLVSDVMTRDPVTVRADQPADEVVALLDRHRFRHLPVVDSGGRLVGIVSDRDTVGRAVAALSWLDEREKKETLHQMRASEIATDSPRTVEPVTPLADAARLMVLLRIDALPVVQAARLIGILTTQDVLRHVAGV